MNWIRRVVVGVAVVLTGCAPVASSIAPVSARVILRAAPESFDLMPTGATAASPAGWVDYCRRNATDVGCGPAR